MMHSAKATKSRKYSNAVEIDCGCGWHESLHLDHDPRFNTMRELWREARFQVADHNDLNDAIRCAYNGSMETTYTFTSAVHYGIPTVWLSTEIEMTDTSGNIVIIDEFWHNGSAGIMASGFKMRKDGTRMNRRMQQMRVMPPQAIKDELNRLNASI